MKNIRILIIALLFLGVAQPAKSQNGFSASAGNAGGEGGSVSFTVGQINHLAVSGSAGTIFQGIQLPFEISVVTGIENPDIDLIWAVYPNPAADFIILKTGASDSEKFFCRFYDLTGNLLIDTKLSGEDSRIDLGNLKPGTYFLRISDNINNLKIFKIIKN